MTTLGLSDGPDGRPERPPVHYQISVTGRQAGFFFLLLLAALVLAFFFGMKTGAAARRGPGAVATLVNASDLPVPTLAPSDGSRETRKSGTAAEEALGFAVEKRAAPKEAAATAASVPVPTAVPTPPPPVPTSPPPAPPKEAVVQKIAPKGPFYVQVLATKKAPAADELRKRLKDEGFAADVSAVPGKEGWFRVRVGPFKERAKAEAAAKKIKATDKQIKNTPLVVP
ncbi:MAG: SPOR domain-containing protein [Acidobacteriota bacterium]